MASRSQSIESLKKQIASYKCTCSLGRRCSCPLPSIIKDCPCWYGQYELCKGLYNGKYAIRNGVKCFTLVNEADARFDMNHPHRLNDLMIWAMNNRHDPFATLPKNIRHLILPTNGQTTLFFAGETGKDDDKRKTRLSKGRYIDPRSGFDYGVWPVRHNKVDVRDPGECAINRTALAEVQQELSAAGLNEAQQVKYYRAVFETQRCLPASFNYPEIFKASQPPPVTSNMARKRGAAIVEEDVHEIVARSAKRSRTVWSESCAWPRKDTHPSTAGSSDKDIASGARRDGFPLAANGLVVPHPAEFYTTGIQGIATGPRGASRLESMNAILKAGLSHQQLKNYLHAADEIKDGWLPSFDYATILGDRPPVIVETRSPILPPAELARTRQREQEAKRRLEVYQEGHQEDQAGTVEEPIQKRRKIAEVQVERAKGKRHFTRSQAGTGAMQDTSGTEVDDKADERNLASTNSGSLATADVSETVISARGTDVIPRSVSETSRSSTQESSIDQLKVEGTMFPARNNGARTRTLLPTGGAPMPKVSGQPTVGPSVTADNAAFVSAMSSGFDRSIWLERAGLGRYPAYITKKGVKHMDDACKYIDNGRLLGRRCEMNERLEAPYASNELFIAKEGKRCSYCTSKNFRPKQCNSSSTHHARRR